MWALLKLPRFGGAPMQTITTIGLDIAKSVFQVHGVDAAGQVVIRRQLKRRYVLAFFQKLPPCLIGIEACASSHYWSRELQALGHTVRLMPPAYVRPYVKRRKNDPTDAEAICPAAGNLLPQNDCPLVVEADQMQGVLACIDANGMNDCSGCLMGHSDVLLVLLSPRSSSERFGAGARPVHPIRVGSLRRTDSVAIKGIADIRRS